MAPVPAGAQGLSAANQKPAPYRYPVGPGAQASVGGVKNARTWCSRLECSLWRPGSGERCSTGIEHGTSKDGSDAGDRESVGWLRLGLAPRTRSLEPVERW